MAGDFAVVSVCRVFLQLRQGSPEKSCRDSFRVCSRFNAIEQAVATLGSQSAMEEHPISPANLTVVLS